MAVLMALMLMLGPWFHGTSVAAYDRDCVASFGADCPDGLESGTPRHHQTDHRGDRSSAGCELLSCGPAIVTSAAGAIDRTVSDDGPSSAQQPLNRLRDGPPLKPPRLI
jgi:hypothetical protein